MPWVKIDDNFFAHPKVIAAGRDGLALYVRCLSYSAHYLTDGFIATAQLTALTDVLDPPAVAELLCAAGLFEHENGGYRIHDFLDYNPSAAQVRAERDAAAQRKAAWRDKQETPAPQPCPSGTDGAVPDLSQPCPTLPDPDPDPDPDPVSVSESARLPETPDSGAETPAPAPEKPPRKRDPIIDGILKVCHYTEDIPAQVWGQVHKAGKELRHLAKPPAAQDFADFEEFWKATDWRGQKGQTPKPLQVVEVWAQFAGAGDWKRNGRRNAPNPSEPAGFAGIRDYMEQIGMDGSELGHG